MKFLTRNRKVPTRNWQRLGQETRLDGTDANTTLPQGFTRRIERSAVAITGREIQEKPRFSELTCAVSREFTGRVKVRHGVVLRLRPENFAAGSDQTIRQSVAPVDPTFSSR
jgi:hypothetical protein